MRDLLSSCWRHNPDLRPSFADIRGVLRGLLDLGPQHQKATLNMNNNSSQTGGPAFSTSFSDVFSKGVYASPNASDTYSSSGGSSMYQPVYRPTTESLSTHKVYASLGAFRSGGDFRVRYGELSDSNDD